VVYDGPPVGLSEAVLDQVYRFDRPARHEAEVAA
jgi:hypothetical protein